MPRGLAAPAADTLQRALRQARRHGPRLVAISSRLPGECDPVAWALRARRAGEPWFCLEQPDAEGAAIAALGSAVELSAAGPNRFEQVAARWRELAAQAHWEPFDGPPGSGLIACGGFAFAPNGGAAPHWSGFAPASLIVPELAIARRGGESWLTQAALLDGSEEHEQLLERFAQRAQQLSTDARLPLLDPHPAGRSRVASAMAPEHFESAVARAVELIRSGELEKVVLAREVDVHAPQRLDAAATFGVLREAFGACMVFGVGRGEASFLAASPELLVRRQGQRVSTLALAGSARRSADPAVDDHLGEQLMQSTKDRGEHAIVVRRVEQALRPHAVWIAAAPEPELARIANIQHLATPIRAQLAQPIGVIELAGKLHPTPAVGGEPRAVAERLIPSLEGLDRGWYSGPVGWTDTREDGEFCVALRCALLEGALARCFAGVGVVRDSDPAQELAETEIKLGALLPVLAG